MLLTSPTSSHRNSLGDSIGLLFEICIVLMLVVDHAEGLLDEVSVGGVRMSEGS